MEIYEPDFGYLESFSGLTRGRGSQLFECLITSLAPSLDFELAKETVFN